MKSTPPYFFCGKPLHEWDWEYDWLNKTLTLDGTAYYLDEFSPLEMGAYRDEKEQSPLRSTPTHR